MLASVSYLLGYRSRRGQDDSVLHDADANDPRRSLLFRRRAESIAGQFEVAFSSDAMSLFGKLESPVPLQDRSLLCGACSIWRALPDWLAVQYSTSFLEIFADKISLQQAF